MDNENANHTLIETVVEKAPPWLVSTAVHFVLMIVLALVVSQLPPKAPREIIMQPAIDLTESNPRYNVRIGDPTMSVTPIIGNDPDDRTENPVWSPYLDGPLGDPINVGLPIEDPMMPGSGTENPDRAPIQSLYDGRDPIARRTAMTNGGGTETTEAGVLRGLHWLARQQYPKGHWSLRRGPRNNSYEAPGVDNWIAATGLALLAFQGHGETWERGQFQENVERGWIWLLRQQDDEGCFFRTKAELATREHPFYTQGICTIAICELYAMTKDPSRKEQFRLAAQKAIDYCVKNQASSGGWRYGLNDFDSDLSVTGWIVMALHSGRIAGLDVPQDTLERVSVFLDSISREGGSRYLYHKDQENVRRSMTAQGLLCRQFLGWERWDPRILKGADWLTESENLVCFAGRDEMGNKNERDVYYWYYATQMLHNLGGRHWKTWNDTMMQQMCENQVQKKGENEGSWDPGDFRWGGDKYASEGRLYITCLSIYILEIYYRHLPIYRSTQ